MMNFIPFSRTNIQKFTLDRPHVLISITDPESDDVVLPQGTGRMSTLHLQFHDIDVKYLPEECKNCGGTQYIEKWKDFNNGICYACSPKAVHFSENDAKQILWYADVYCRQVDTILVNCEAGRSRSVAVCAALSKIYNGENSDVYFFEHYTPNMKIYRTILDTYYGRGY